MPRTLRAGFARSTTLRGKRRAALNARRRMAVAQRDESRVHELVTHVAVNTSHLDAVHRLAALWSLLLVVVCCVWCLMGVISLIFHVNLTPVTKMKYF
eukprot:scaffold323415_cov35-Tisochrysis_lutea.AAC.4